MIRRAAIVLFELSFLGIILPVFGQEAGNQPVQMTSMDRVNFAPGGTIRINGSYGDLRVEGWDRPEVEITVTKSVGYREGKTSEKDQRRLESIHVATDHSSPTELTISTLLASRHGNWAPPLPARTTNGVTVEYQIYAPRDSKLVIRHGTGSVFVSRITGDVDVSGSRGDILLMLPASGAYEIDARTKFGKVSSDLQGSTISRYVIGQKFARTLPPPSRRLHLRMGFGGITITTLPPEADAPVPAGTK